MNLVDRKDFYLYKCPPDKYEETKSRLQRIQDAGMTEVGIASFGIAGIMSGFYIEMVWNQSDKDFDNYMEWVEKMKSKHGKTQPHE